MSPALSRILDDERAQGCPGLAGSRVVVHAGVRDAAIDEWIASVPLPSAIESVQVAFGERGAMTVRGAVRVFGFRKRVAVPLRLASSADLSRGVVIHLAFDGASLVASAASWFGPLLGALPRGVSVDERGVTIDLQPTLAGRGLGDVSRYLRALDLETTAGRLVVRATLEAPASEAGGVAVAGTSPAPEIDSIERTRGGRPGLAALVEEAGAEIRLRVSDALATAALQGVMEDTPTARAPRTPWPVAWSRPPRVRFETGAMVVDAVISTTARA